MTVPSAQPGSHASTPALSEKTSDKASLGNESPIDTDSSDVEEFKEGGYGW
jgi:hypothetical protein